MRIVPILTALIVIAVLYGLVFERDRLFEFAGVATAAQPADADQGDQAASADATGDETALDVVRVIAKKSSAREIDSAVVLRGETEAARQVEVRAETAGLVVSDPLRKGAFVQQGQMMCELDPGTRQAQLSEAQARLAEARARAPEAEARLPAARAALEEARARLEEAMVNANAANRLSEDGFASETRVKAAAASMRAAEAAVSNAEAGVESARTGVESARAAIQSAEAAVAAAQKEIDRLTIAAPFSGLLESDTAELGSLLQPGSPCATIIQLDPIKIVGFVPETDVNRVEVGAMAGARLSGNTEVQGRVTFLSRSADPVTRTFRVEITTPNADLALRDGQTAEIVIQSEGANAHLLPQSTLTLDDDGTLGVRVVDADMRARFIAVTILRDTREGIWVTGLPDEANVIVVGQEFVIDGVPVEPSYEEVIQ